MVAAAGQARSPQERIDEGAALAAKLRDEADRLSAAAKTAMTFPVQGPAERRLRDKEVRSARASVVRLRRQARELDLDVERLGSTAT